MQIFELSPQHRLLALGHAQRATAGSKGKWLLGDYTESRFSGDSVASSRPGQRILESNVTAGFLGLAVQDPDQLTSRALWRLISYFRTNALDSREYVFAFWSRIARTAAIAFAVLLAIPFVLGCVALRRRRHPHDDGAGVGSWVFPAAAPDRKRHGGIRPGSGATRLDTYLAAGDGDPDTAGAGAVGQRGPCAISAPRAVRSVNRVPRRAPGAGSAGRCGSQPGACGTRRMSSPAAEGARSPPWPPLPPP